MSEEKALCGICTMLLSVAEKVRPKRVFFIKYFLLFGCQPVRIVCKHIEKRFLVKRENKLALAFFSVVYPPYHIGGVILEQFI